MADTALVTPADMFEGRLVALRLVTEADVSERYVGWLHDADVKRYLETRFQPQSLDTVRAFVRATVADPASFLFAILDRADGRHVGNLKIGPVNQHHSFADVSYFIGERDRWGKGLATDAIRVSISVGFNRLALHRLQAGVYEKNVGSCRALEAAGFAAEGRFAKQLLADDGWQDHLWYGLVRRG